MELYSSDLVLVLWVFVVNVVFHCTAEQQWPQEARRARFVKRLPRTQRSSPGPQLPVSQAAEDSLPVPYLRLPMFLDSVKPLLDSEHFQPFAGTGLEPLPNPVQELLRPADPDQRSSPRPEPTEPQPEASVRIDCKRNRMFVEVDHTLLGSGDLESTLRLGSCIATKATEKYVYFESKLNKCGTRQTMEQDQVVFSNTLYFEPEKSQSHIRRTAPFSLPLSCHFNRFQYSYKIGYKPKLRVRTLFKQGKNKEKFTLSPRNSLWEPLSSSDAFTLGRPMYFEAQAELPSPGQRLYVHSCFATSEPSPSSTPQFTIVKNYGCMVESKHGRSSFIAHRNDAVRFSVDAFIFHGFEGNLYMHCSMSVAPDTSTVTEKSCNYHPPTRRWVELYGSSVCSCCDSYCGPSASAETVISTSSWNIKIKPGVSRRKTKSQSEFSKRKSKSFRPKTVPGNRGERGESQAFSEAVRWVVTTEEPQDVEGFEEVEGIAEVEELEHIFNLDLYDPPPRTVK